MPICSYIILSFFWIYSSYKKTFSPENHPSFFSPRIAPWACVVKISLSALVVIFCLHIHWAPWTKVVGWWSLDCSGWMFFAPSLRFLTHPPPSDGNTHQTLLNIVTPRNLGLKKRCQLDTPCMTSQSFEIFDFKCLTHLNSWSPKMETKDLVSKVNSAWCIDVSWHLIWCIYNIYPMDPSTP